ncbi:MAG: hypothetical protein RPR28_08295 [Cycloclasticus sp.]
MDADQVVLKGLFSSGVYCRQPQLSNPKGGALIINLLNRHPISYQQN